MKLYSFVREAVDAERAELILAGDVDGLMAAEVAARIFAAEDHADAIVCDVTHHPDQTPRRPTPAVKEAAVRAESRVAVELLPPSLI